VYPNFAADTAKLLQQFAADNRKDPGLCVLRLCAMWRARTTSPSSSLAE
jgi:hypothetical protein